MNVYCMSCELEGADGFSRATNAVFKWLSKKVGSSQELGPKDVFPDQILRFGRTELHGAAGESPEGFFSSIRLKHPDEKVHGRSWVVEASFEKPRDANRTPMFSTRLLTEERSILASEPVTLTRPSFVPQIVAGAVPITPGRKVMVLDAETASEIDELLDRPNRKAPVVILSQSPAGTLACDPERLRLQLCGVAEVVVLAGGVDHQDLHAVLGVRRVPFDGAVHVSYVPSGVRGPRDWRFLPGDIAEWTDPISELALRVFRFTNAIHDSRHLSYRRTVERRRQALFAQELAELARDDESDRMIVVLQNRLEELESSHKAELDEADQRYQGEIDDLYDRYEADLRTLDSMKAEAREKESLIATLRTGLDRKREGEGLPAEVRDRVVACLGGTGSVRDALETIASLFPERVLVLESARQSADQSYAFRQPERALNLLIQLAGSYWEGLCSGFHDREAARCFGDGFAARESTTVEGTPRLKRQRTFSYRGADIFMPRHLKIGVKDSPAETLRIYFHWDSDERLIVIGHCGPHLPLS